MLGTASWDRTLRYWGLHIGCRNTEAFRACITIL